MQVSVETGEGLKRRVHIDLPYERLQGEVDKRLSQIARSARLPGFRPGKVPMKLVRQRYGDQVQQEVFGELVQSSFSDAVTNESLRPAGMPEIQPRIDVTEKRLGYTASFEVLPEVALAPLGERTIERPVAEVTDADLEGMIERLRTQRTRWIAAERPAETGDRVTIAFTGTIEGEPFEGGSGSGVQVELGSGRMIPGFEEGLVGAASGDTLTLELAFPEDYRVESLKGKPVRFEVRMEEVSSPELPALDSDFARAFGIADGDLDRFRADVRANMDRELKQRIKARTKERVMDLLIEANTVEIPEVLVRDEIRTLKEQMRRNLGAQAGQMELPDGLFADAARRRVALGLIVGEIVKTQGIEADAARVRAEVEEIASTYEDPASVLSYYYADRSRLAPVESLVLEDQVVDWVLGQVQARDEPQSFAQLTEPAGA